MAPWKRIEPSALSLSSPTAPFPLLPLKMISCGPITLGRAGGPRHPLFAVTVSSARTARRHLECEGSAKMLHKESETQLSHIAWQHRRVRRHTVTERQVIGRASECNDLQKWTVRLPTFVERRPARYSHQLIIWMNWSALALYVWRQVRRNSFALHPAWCRG